MYYHLHFSTGSHESGQQVTPQARHIKLKAHYYLLQITSVIATVGGFYESCQ
jgi:hypothetical protein